MYLNAQLVSDGADRRSAKTMLKNNGGEDVLRSEIKLHYNKSHNIDC